jgi:thiol:disulfide interchange protein DsbG
MSHTHRIHKQALAAAVTAACLCFTVQASAGLFGAITSIANAAESSGVPVPSTVYDAGNVVSNLRDAQQQVAPQQQETATQIASPPPCPPGYNCQPVAPVAPVATACPPGETCTPDSAPVAPVDVSPQTTPQSLTNTNKFAGMWTALKGATYIQIGHGPTVIYDYFDPMCMYCFKLFDTERTLIHEGYLTVRYVPIDRVQPQTSPYMDAWILQSQDRAARLAQFSSLMISDNQRGEFSNLPRANPSAATSAILAQNEHILVRYHMTDGVPIIVYRGKHGMVHAFYTPDTTTPAWLLQRIDASRPSIPQAVATACPPGEHCTPSSGPVAPIDVSPVYQSNPNRFSDSQLYETLNVPPQ